jgi:copper homeostasis protein CutC
VDGVVVGALRSDGSLDDAALRRLVAVAKGQRCRLGLPKTAASPAKPAKPAKLAAGGVGGGRLEFLPPMTVTFHRAFDVCADAEDTLRRLHRLRVRRSGGFLSDDVDSLFDAFDDGDGDRTGTQGPDEEEERQEKEKREKKRPDESVGDEDNPLFGVGADSEGTKRRRTRRTSRAKEAQEGGWVHGVDMVLTSGQAASAWEGRDRLRRLQEVLDRLNGAAGSSSRGSGGGDSGTFLRLMAGAGVHAGNASAIADYVGLADVHAGSALMDDVLSATAQHQQRLKQQQQVSDGGGGGHGSGGSSVSGSGVSMGPGSKGREHLIRRTAASKVRALVASLEK